MKRAILVSNSASGNAAAIDDGALIASLEQGGFEIVARTALPDVALPDRQSVEAQDIQTVVICAGDGTVSGMCKNLAGWPGEILVLPGGTMNLLARRLHGEITMADILPSLPQIQEEAAPIAVVVTDGCEIFTGMTVGPSTRWGEVREGMRQGDVEGLREMVPTAWSETMGEDGVWLQGQPQAAYAGIFIEPFEANNVNVIAFKANSVADMVGHGLAWIRRDFRTGPRDDLGIMPSAVVTGDHAVTGVLIDGELEDRRLPLTCTAAMSSVRFLRLRR